MSAPESLAKNLIVAQAGEVGAVDRNAGFIRQMPGGQSLCRLKSAFLAKDSGARTLFLPELRRAAGLINVLNR
jgi:hypothetical protein